MLRRIIEYLRSSFCKHDYELLEDHDIYKEQLGEAKWSIDEKGYLTYDMVDHSKPPILIGHRWTYRCTKCNHVMIINSKDEED